MGKPTHTNPQHLSLPASSVIRKTRKSSYISSNSSTIPMPLPHSRMTPTTAQTEIKCSSLDLSRNKLIGTILESFRSFKNQNFYLILSHNFLSEAIPKSFRKYNFLKIDLSRNNLIRDA
ncbi:Polygalacturonase inhibitor 1-like protein [Drosera capensis]